jgi:ABC-type transport system involved in cytochrome c biogenesis permease subunit
LRLGAVANALAILAASYFVLAPLFTSSFAPEMQARSTLPDYDYEPWRSIPVQHGRIMPLDTFARDTVRHITGRVKFEDHDPVAIILAWWLTEGRGANGGYTNWEEYPFILCDHHGLRAKIYEHVPGASDGQFLGKRISPAELRRSPGFDALVAEVSKARQEFGEKAHLHLSPEHLKAEEVGRRLVLYDQICGRAITRLHTNALSSEQFIDVPQLAAIADKPPEEALNEFERNLRRHPDPLRLFKIDRIPDGEWLSIRELDRLLVSHQPGSDYVKERREANFKEHGIERHQLQLMLHRFQGLRMRYHMADEPLFRHDMTRLSPSSVFVVYRVSLEESEAIDLELSYNRYQPFMWSWVTMLAAAVMLFAALMTSSRIAYILGVIVYLASLGIQVAGFYARIAISGWAPVTNMYESVIFVAFVAGVFAMALELIYRRTVIALAGAVVATLGLVLADQMPLAFDPKISPIVPVLRDNYWLTIHVLTIVCGYGAGTLAWGLGNISLAMLAFGKGTEENLKMLARFTYRAMQLTVLLLAAGTFLGGWWAAEAWGRFWGWDPKEVGALIALVCYVIPLHARYIGWVKEFGLAVSAVLCFAAILVSWYVVNFVLAAGLHSYGFGGGGGQWVLWAGLLNLEWVFLGSLWYWRRAVRAESEYK